MKAFLRAVLWCATLGLVGCGTVKMKATGDCQFKAVRTESTGYGSRKSTYQVPADMGCQFHLEAPVKRADDAIKFADGFKAMFQAVPGVEDVKPDVKVELKEDKK